MFLILYEGVRFDFCKGFISEELKNKQVACYQIFCCLEILFNSHMKF